MPTEKPDHPDRPTPRSWLEGLSARTMWIGLGIACVTLSLTLYHGALHTPLSSDARFLSFQNAYVRDPVGFLKFWTADFFEGSITNGVPYRSGYYRPLTNILFWIEYRWAGDQAVWYNLSQIVLHAANGVIVALLCLRLGGTRIAAVLAGLIFVVHPVHAFSATEPAARSDVVFPIIYVLAILAFDAALRASDRKTVTRLVGLTTLLYLGTLLSKEMGVTLPAVLVLLVLLHHYRDGVSLRRMIRVIPVWITLGVYLVWRFGIIKSTPQTLGYTETYETPILALAAIKGLAIQLSRIVLPVGATYPELNPRMVNFVADPLADPLTYAAIAIVVGLLIMACLWKQHPVAAFWSGFFFLTYAPLFQVDNIVGSLGTNVVLTEERWIYLPSMAVVVGAGLLADRLARLYPRRAPRVALTTAVIALLLVLAASAQAHVGRHDDPHARLRRLYLLPDERLSRLEKANKLLLYAQWVALPLGQNDEAERRAREAVALVPDSPLSATALANVLGQRGKWGEVIPLLTPWLAPTAEELDWYARTNNRVGDDLNRVNPMLAFLLGLAYSHTGDREKGVRFLCESLRRGFDSTRVVAAFEETGVTAGPGRCREGP